MKLKPYQVFKVTREPFRPRRPPNTDIHLIAYDKVTMEFNPVAFREEDRLVIVLKHKEYREYQDLWECYKLKITSMDLETVKYYAEDTNLTFIMNESEVTEYCDLDVLNTFRLQKQLEEYVEQTDT